MLEPAPIPVRTKVVRTSVLALVGMLALLVTGALAAADGARAATPRHGEQLRFMWAMAQQESGGDYFSRNRTSGAFGKYQIMPFNWPAWADQFVGDSQADQTPYNQERVAYAKIGSLYRWLGSWKRVAYWWLTGSSESNQKRWSSYAAGYVDNIMALRRRAPRDVTPRPARASHYASRGDWRRSGSPQRLRLEVAGKAWPRRGRLQDGQVIRVRSTAVRHGVRWMRVMTVDGRLGWLPQQRTVPTRRPASARRFADVTDTGTHTMHRDRRLVRPRPH